MRPVRLRIQNFTCYKGDVELDFSPLKLFAISGRTGAGKSSLLDAMIFALYGSVPRLGSTGLAELISAGCDRMAVTFDFMHGGRTYRVMRAARRKGATEAQLEEIVDGEERSVADGVRDTDSHVVELLGQSYNAFVQAVVLPQGDFAKFLRSKPADRQKLLSDLLRLAIYEVMRKEAASRRVTGQTQVDVLESQLTTDFADATPESAQALETQIETTAADIDAKKQSFKRADTELSKVRAAFEKTTELTQEETRLAKLESQRKQITALERQVDAAKRAQPILPLIEAVRAAEKRAQDDKEAANTASWLFDKADETAQQLAKVKAQAQADAKELPAHRERLKLLDQATGKLPHRDQLAKQLSKAKDALISAKTAFKNATQAEAKAGDAQAKAERSLSNALTALEQTGFDRKAYAKYEACEESASALATLRGSLADIEARTQETKTQCATRRKAAASAKDQESKAAAQLAETASSCANARAELDSAKQSESAVALRAHLHVGERCPVCEQTVRTLPELATTTDLAQAAKMLEAMEAAEQSARQKHDDARVRATKAEAAATEGEQTLSLLVAQTATLEKQISTATDGLTRTARELVPISTTIAIEEQLLDALAGLKAKRVAFEEADEARNNALATSADAALAHEKATGAVKTASDRVVQLEDEIERAQTGLAKVEAEIKAVTTSRDPIAERYALAKEIGTIEETLKTALAEHADAMAELASAKKAADAAGQNATRARADADQAKAKADDDATAAGFKSITEAQKSVLSAATLRQHENAINSWQKDHAAATERIGKLKKTLGDQRVSKKALEDHEHAQEGARTAHEAAVANAARLAEQRAQLAQRIKRAAEIRATADAARAETALYARLAEDLRAHRFQAFLLEDTLMGLMRGASDRLWSLSSRYRFKWQDDTFYVVDHDNARQERPADTLSGGETFLASLALALELSEQIQQASGSVPLDSLFIDEGFGTLDAEALDVAASAIESLQLGGRMVGIITHIDELSRRLPARILVSREGPKTVVEVDVH